MDGLFYVAIAFLCIFIGKMLPKRPDRKKPDRLYVFFTESLNTKSSKYFVWISTSLFFLGALFFTLAAPSLFPWFSEINNYLFDLLQIAATLVITVFVLFLMTGIVLLKRLVSRMAHSKESRLNKFFGRTIKLAFGFCLICLFGLAILIFWKPNQTNWRTYNFKENHFSIMSPFSFRQVENQFVAFPGNDFYADVAIIDVSKNETVDAVLQKYLVKFESHSERSFQTKKITSISIAGFPGEIAEERYAMKVPLVGVSLKKLKLACFENGNRVVLIDINYNFDDALHEEIANRMINSFKFID